MNSAGFYLFLANIVAILHIILVISPAIIFWALLMARKEALAFSIFASLYTTMFSSHCVFGGCPLTIMEKSLRRLAGDTSMVKADGFISYYLAKFTGFVLPEAFIDAALYIVLAFSASTLIIFLIIKAVRSANKKHRS